MTKFSDFIRNLGTAGPATLQGIYNLGFALRSEIPELFAKYLRVDAAQSFTNTEKAQGRANLGTIIGADVQAYSASLSSLASLSTNANLLPYTTAPDTWAVTSLTAFGRTLVSSSDASAGRTALGLGTISTQNANAVNITGGSVTGITDLAVGDGGTGASTPSSARSNLGLAIGSDVQAYSARLTLLAGLVGVDGSFIRWTGATTAVMQSIVGTVSQSGGIPTGAIVERGSNANGEFVRYADGTQICWGNPSVGDASLTAGSVFSSPAETSWTFPAAFAAPPACSAGGAAASSGRWMEINSTLATAARLNVWSYITRPAGSVTVRAQAIGRWF